MWKRQKKILAALGIFLGLMYLCTLISRAVYAKRLPQVEVRKPAAMSVEHRVEAEGMVLPGQEYALCLPPGLRVHTVYAHVGDRVEADTLLFELDMEALDELVRQKEQAVQKLELQLRAAEEERAAEESRRQTELARAQEDYLRADREGRADMEDAEEGRELMEAGRSRENAMREAQRRMEDAAASVTADSAQELARIEWSEAKAELEKYRTVQKQEGKVCLGTDGILTELFVSAGAYVPDGTAVRYAAWEDPGRFYAVLTKEQKEYVNQGDRVELELGGVSCEATVDYLAQREADPGQYEAEVLLPEGSAHIGQSGYLRAESGSELFEVCIPTEALHTDSTQRSYVYAVREREGILGTELVAEQIYVKVLDQNERYAALEPGVIDRDTEVIVTATEALADRMTVRYRDEI